MSHIYSGDEDCGDEITSGCRTINCPCGCNPPEPKCPLKASVDAHGGWLLFPCCLPLGHKGPCRAE